MAPSKPTIRDMRPPGSSPISKGEAYRQYPCMLLDVEVSYGDLISEADDGSHPVPDRESAKDQPWCYCPLVFVFRRVRAVYPMGVTELDFGPEVEFGYTRSEEHTSELQSLAYL